MTAQAFVATFSPARRFSARIGLFVLLLGFVARGQTESDSSPELGRELPQVLDPLLEPLPPAARRVSDWREALRLVRSRSTTLATTRAQAAQAAAQARQALGRLYPTLTATGSANRHLLLGRGTNITERGAQVDVRIPDPATLWSAGLALRQPLVDLRAWHDAGTAKRAQNAVGARSEDSERLLLADLADAIVSTVTAERLAEISRVALRSSLEASELTRRRERLGASTAVDVLRADQEVVLNRAQVIAANEALLRSREALGVALGYAEEFSVAPEIKLNELAKDAAQVCRPARPGDERADIRAARAEVELARRGLDSTDYAFAPTLDLTSNLTYTSARFTSNGQPVQWTVGGLLTIPLYDGGLRYAERADRSAQVLAADATLTERQRQAQLETRQALRGVQVARQNFEVSQHSRNLAAEAARLARVSFMAGRATSFELVDATQRSQQSELDLVVKEFEVVRSQIIALLAQANCDL